MTVQPPGNDGQDAVDDIKDLRTALAAFPNLTNYGFGVFSAGHKTQATRIAEMLELLAKGPAEDSYTVSRRVYFLGGPIRYSGWQRDRVVRLVRRGAARHSNSRVHPKVITRGLAPLLKSQLQHFMVDDLHEYLRRTVKYGYWGASQAWREGRRSSMPVILFRTAWRFMRTYFVQLGILDGTRGVVFCLCQAFATYSKWSILWSWHVNAARGIAPDLPVFDEDETTWTLPVPPTTTGQ